MEVRVVGVHSVASAPQDEFGKAVANMERDCMKRVASPDTQITMRFPTWGLRGIDGFFYSLTHRLNERITYQQIVAAEKEGFDAAIIICFYDPLLRELRTAVDIPVVGLAEASMHMANIIGDKFGIISFTNQSSSDTEKMVEAYGLSQKCVGIAPMSDVDTGWLAATMSNPPDTVEKTIEQIKKPAIELVRKGAEVILVG
jgi:allantoin racemase